MTTSVATVLARALREAGATHLFGVPGGGASAELIEAARHVDLPFVLAHTETAGAFMACAQAEVRRTLGACLATLGPGAASVANGVAHAWLDRVPLVVLTDRHPTDVQATAQHQTLDHHALFGGITKATIDLSAHARDELASVIACAMTPPWGPVHVDLAPDALTAPAEPASASPPPPEPMGAPVLPAAVARMLAAARRPLLLVGLGARAVDDAAAVRALCERRGLPALVTYKAKGVVPDRHPWFAGVFTDAALEAPLLEQADLLLAIGLDAVELLPRPWRHRQPVVSVGRGAVEQPQVPFAASLAGDLPATLALVADALNASTWVQTDVDHVIRAQRDALRVPSDGLAPFRVVELVAERFAGRARLTVDAGAHMLPAMALWPANEPHDVLISNGLATMGFALPSAIGLALLDARRPVVALTGDGGLLMCVAELRTAARLGLRVRVVVFDDASLSLIRIKQEARGYAPLGVDLGGTDWVAVAEAFGVRGFVARDEASLQARLRDADAVDGPSLVAAQVDGSVYLETMRRLRG